TLPDSPWHSEVASEARLAAPQAHAERARHCWDIVGTYLWKIVFSRRDLRWKTQNSGNNLSAAVNFLLEQLPFSRGVAFLPRVGTAPHPLAPDPALAPAATTTLSY